MSWLKNLLSGKIRTGAVQKKGVPEGLWNKCDACSSVLYHTEWERCQSVCPKCGHHHRIRARKRLLSLLDEGTPVEIGAEVLPVDRLKFRDSKKYKLRLQIAQKNSGESEALIVMQGTLHGLSLVAAAYEFEFMGGSMGAAVGERFCQGAHTCLEYNLPLVCFMASGGARMQEGLMSLMQMAKTSAALAQMSARGLPFISILTDPTMGGVSASMAMLGDVIIAEPGALIGFAGPRVIEQTVRQVLPDGFQRAEFLLKNGAVDMILDRRSQRDTLARLLAKLTRQPFPVSPDAIA